MLVVAFYKFEKCLKLEKLHGNEVWQKSRPCSNGNQQQCLAIDSNMLAFPKESDSTGYGV